MKNNIKAILFDLDGVVIDSEPLHFEAHKKILEDYGVELTLEDYLDFGVAKGDSNLYREVSERFGVSIDNKEMAKRKKQAYWEILDKKGELMPGILEILQNFSKEYALAIVSSGVKVSVEHVLDKFNIKNYFKVIVTGGDVAKVKPAPDVYLKAMELFGYNKEDCIAIEDSETGVAAAKNAGIKCFAIPNDFTKKQDFSRADVVLSSIKELKIL